jgi:hypothetical protein
MDIEMQSGATETGCAQILAAASIGKASTLCYSLINRVKVESNTSLIEYNLK